MLVLSGSITWYWSMGIGIGTWVVPLEHDIGVWELVLECG